MGEGRGSQNGAYGSGQALEGMSAQRTGDSSGSPQRARIHRREVAKGATNRRRLPPHDDLSPSPRPVPNAKSRCVPYSLLQHR